jgi:hypothetical protein
MDSPYCDSNLAVWLDTVASNWLVDTYTDSLSGYHTDCLANHWTQTTGIINRKTIEFVMAC